MLTGNEERENLKKTVMEKFAAMGIDNDHCRSCGEPIIFLKTTRGKWQPVDFYLESHFANCPNAKEYRR